jgi:two-component system nitrate/nitrite response regulator NarL
MCPRRKINVVVADGMPVVLEGLKAALSQQENISVLEAISTGERCFKVIKDKNPDVALVDMNLPDMSGDELVKKCKSKGINTRFIIISNSCDHNDLFNSIKAGVDGFILKTSPIEEIIKAIETVYPGGTYFCEKIREILNNNQENNVLAKPPVYVLSKREIEILKLIASGLTTKEIASKLNVSPRTVDTHRQRIMSKLNIHNVAGLTMYAIKQNIINP